MFTENMTYWDMNRILLDIEHERNLKVVDLVEKHELSKQDIELFLDAYLNEFKLDEGDLNNINKVAPDIFDLSSILQHMRTNE
ncbi:hypothetical protein ACQKNC_10600 [Lysinibacillus sp. NPDC094177]|uniref:hypothetical protein n=1 Tax=Lysinibacillus sp. NPDC094177 TaxID=3390580 RepID=UPI003D02912B